MVNRQLRATNGQSRRAAVVERVRVEQVIRTLGDAENTKALEQNHHCFGEWTLCPGFGDLGRRARHL